MTNQNEPPLLLTPGPLTTSTRVKEAMLRDWGSRDKEFIDLTRRIRERLVDIAGAGENYTCVPLQGSGTFVVEAAIDTFIPKEAKTLVLINGAYGHRIAKICALHAKEFVAYETGENEPPSAGKVEALLENDPSITHVVAVHCETTSGILNPIDEIAAAVHGQKRNLIIDAMSSFGALDLNLSELKCAAVVASSNKCLEGVPGIGFAIVEKDLIRASSGNASSLSLDLHDQWSYMESSGQWRFTPPTHVLAAFDQAIQEHADEGGVEGRRARYDKNCHALLEGMKNLGFETYLSDNLQAPIIVTFHTPADDNFEFDIFYEKLRDKGFAIYPGKLTKLDSFRIGCIGHLTDEDMTRAVAAVSDVVLEMGVKNLAGANQDVARNF